MAWTSSPNESSSMESDVPVWQLQYSAPRGSGVQTRIRAAGSAPRATGLAWLEELAEMLVALCDNWPVSESTVDVVEEATAPTVAAEEPRILAVPWRHAVPAADQHESGHQASGIDAA
jgi:hypothetical protein